MAQRNTYREDEELEEQINFRDILRVGKYLKPYTSFRISFSSGIPWHTTLLTDVHTLLGNP